jgi:hypothetical protein
MKLQCVHLFEFMISQSYVKLLDLLLVFSNICLYNIIHDSFRTTELTVHESDTGRHIYQQKLNDKKG